jgi:pimeloyl-ACP methyl ester carboxylesterase
MSADASAKEPRYRDGYVAVADGLRLHYRDYPGPTGKPPLLCLHGLTRNSRDFADFAERYSPKWRVLALDFRGRGASEYDPLPSRYNPLTYASDVIQLLDQLMIEQAVFVGTSLGGLVTMTMAAMAPQRIAASILNDVGPDLTTTGLDRIRSYVGKDGRFPGWDEAAIAIAANNQHLPESYTHADWVKMAHRVCREDKGAIVFDYDMAIALPFETQGPVPKIDMWPLFKALGQKPLLVVRGERSDLLSAEALEKMQAAVPDMKSVTVPGVGHAPMLDEPEALSAIDSFLASLET